MNSLARFDWTDDNLANMEKWRAEGLSATTIAAQLGHGCTRSAVLGKIHRLRVANGHIPVPHALVGTRRPPKPRVPKVALPIAQEPTLMPDGERVTILHLSDKTCRWPIGDVGSPDFCFCGHRPETSPPYCDFHTRVASNGFPTRKIRSATVDRRWGA